MKKILVVGGGTYQTPLIKRLREFGHAAYCVDRDAAALGFEYADGHKVIDVTDEKRCLEYAEELEIDGVMTYGATITLPTVAYIGEKLGLPALPHETAVLSKNKYEMKKRLCEHGLNTLGDFFKLTFPDDGKNRKLAFPCVVKPCDGSGSRGVSVAKNKSEFDAAVKYAYDNARYGEIYVESFIDGTEYSVETFACGGKTHVYAIVKTVFAREANGEVTYGHSTPCGLPHDDEIKIENEVEKAVKALGVTLGSANFDVIFSHGKPYIIDCGIRVGQNLIASHIVSLSRGVDVTDNAIKAALGEAIEAEPKFKKCVATRLLIYSPGVISEIKPFDALLGQNGICDIVLRKRAGDVQNEYREKSDTCGWVVAEGTTPEHAEENARRAKEILKNYIIIKPFRR